MRRFRDVRYAARSHQNVFDLDVPETAEPPPLVVFIHGGAFLGGDKTDSATEREALLAAGFAVATVNYRLTDEAIWPAQLDDLREAFAVLRRDRALYGIDSGRVASFGPSAGGHLSASCGIALASSPATALAASIVWFPPVDFPTMDADIEATGVDRATPRNDGPDSPESRLIGAAVATHPELARAAGPIARLEELPAGTQLPDVLIMHGARDPYIGAGQSRRLHAALSAYGTCRHLELDILPEGTHGGGQFEEGATMARVIAFLERAFATPRDRAR